METKVSYFTQSEVVPPSTSTLANLLYHSFVEVDEDGAQQAWWVQIKPPVLKQRQIMVSSLKVSTVLLPMTVNYLTLLSTPVVMSTPMERSMITQLG
jgi:hypothetical protein